MPRSCLRSFVAVLLIAGTCLGLSACADSSAPPPMQTMAPKPALSAPPLRGY